MTNRIRNISQLFFSRSLPEVAVKFIRIEEIQHSAVQILVLILEERDPLSYALGFFINATHQRLNHSSPALTKTFDRLKDVDHPFGLESVNQNAQRNETPCATGSSTTETKKLKWEEAYTHVLPVLYLQCTITGLSPHCVFHLSTCPIKSIMPVPIEGHPLFGHAVYWNCLTGVDCPSFVNERCVRIREQRNVGKYFVGDHQFALNVLFVFLFRRLFDGQLSVVHLS